jgi:hypothetical protein
MKQRTDTPEMVRFNDALRQIVQVSKEDLNRLLKDEKAVEATRQKRGPKPSSSARASRDKD